MVLDTAHIISPILLAWSQPKLRAIVRREWGAHLLFPAIIVLLCFKLDMATILGLGFAWNVYHYGAQNFGVASLYGAGRDRALRALICVGGTVLIFGLVPQFWPSIFGFNHHPGTLSPALGILLWSSFAFNHWLTDIALSSRVAKWHWPFIAIVLALGAVWLGLSSRGLLSDQTVQVLVRLRAAVGFIHFVYSARIWKLSDPQVRETIGEELFA